MIHAMKCIFFPWASSLVMFDRCWTLFTFTECSQHIVQHIVIVPTMVQSLSLYHIELLIHCGVFKKKEKMEKRNPWNTYTFAHKCLIQLKCWHHYCQSINLKFKLIIFRLNEAKRTHELIVRKWNVCSRLPTPLCATDFEQSFKAITMRYLKWKQTPLPSHGTRNESKYCFVQNYH